MMDDTTNTGDDLARVEASIDNLIHDLQVERAHVRRSANALGDVTRVFPPETLTSIFEFIVHDNDCPIYIIAAVCFRWRQIIWTSPTLWTTISLNSTRHGVWDHFNLHCQNAKDAPLTIHLSTYHGFQAPLRPLLQLSAAVFTDCTNRITSVSLGPVDRVIWDHLSSFVVSVDFPRLKVLTLEFKRSFQALPEGILFFHSPCLREIAMTEPPPGIEFHLPFQQLTSLTLRKTCPTHALTLLTHCPNLIRYSSEGVCATEPAISKAETPITLHHLESFGWDSGDCPVNATFISDIHLPSVLRLCWLGPLDPATATNWYPFFSSMSMVKSLECTYSTGLLALLDSLPSLQRVHIKFDLFFGRLAAITDVMSYMVYTQDTETLPHLTELAITLVDQSRVVSKEILPFQDIMIEALQSRRLRFEGIKEKARLRRFTLELSVLAVWGTWEGNLVGSLRRLEQSGLEVMIAR